MRQYMANRRAERRTELIAALGGRCVRDGCGATSGLEFDHTDPAARSFRLSGKGLDRPWPQLVAEAAKCQLLCHQHHWEKTLATGEVRTVEHGGGVSGKRNCPCKPCRDRKSEYNRAYGHPSRVAQSAAATPC